MARSKSTFKEYLIEFFIVLLGITIAFWLSNLGEVRKERRLELAYLEDLNSDLDKDFDALDYSIRMNTLKLKKLSRAVDFYQGKVSTITPDSLPGYAGLIGNYFHYSPNDYTYLSLQQSGDFSIIKDRSLKRKLIGIYEKYELIETEQVNLLGGLDQNYFPILMSSIDMVTGEIVKPEYFMSADFKNILNFTMNEISTLINLYSSVQKEVLDLKDGL